MDVHCPSINSAEMICERNRARGRRGQVPKAAKSRGVPESAVVQNSLLQSQCGGTEPFQRCLWPPMDPLGYAKVPEDLQGWVLTIILGKESKPYFPS